MAATYVLMYMGGHWKAKPYTLTWIVTDTLFPSKGLWWFEWEMSPQNSCSWPLGPQLDWNFRRYSLAGGSTSLWMGFDTVAPPLAPYLLLVCRRNVINQLHCPSTCYHVFPTKMDSTLWNRKPDKLIFLWTVFGYVILAQQQKSS